jgi:hypothetical protein
VRGREKEKEERETREIGREREKEGKERRERENLHNIGKTRYLVLH